MHVFLFILVMTIAVMTTGHQALLADTVYVRDTLYVPLRGGQSKEHRILHRGLRSGTMLERLEVNKETGYSRVRLESGQEGWIQSQYLVDEPIARIRLEEEQTRFTELDTRYQRVTAALQKLETTELAITTANNELTTRNTDLKTELDKITNLASNIIAIDEENKQLRGEHDALLAEIDALSVANQSFQDTSDRKWFLNGAGTILVGLLFGFWFSRKIYHKRGGGWS